MDDIQKLNLNKFPPKNDFYDILNDEYISDNDYKRAKIIWKTFNCQNLGEYSYMYLKST